MGSTKFSQQELKNLDWDDTQLIEAYDKAKAKAAAKIKKLKKKSSENPSSSEDKQWQVGSYCRALYSEDGYYYEAKVLELDNEGFCTVEFLGYEDIEEVEVKKLKHSKGKRARKEQIKSVLESSAMSLTCAESDAESASVASSAAKMKNRKKYYEDNHQPLQFSCQAAPCSQSFMAPPPLPPPMPHNINDPAMGALLRSWYLAGYYAGRYEQTQRETSYSAPCCCSHANQCCKY